MEDLSLKMPTNALNVNALNMYIKRQMIRMNFFSKTGMNELE